jgi:hypothetical protein
VICFVHCVICFVCLCWWCNKLAQIQKYTTQTLQKDLLSTVLEHVILIISHNYSLVNRKPTRYNPYVRPAYEGKAYRPDNYEPNYGPQENEEASEISSNDFFGLSDAQESVTSTNAFPGYQAYEETEEASSIIPDYGDDELPPPSLDNIPSNNLDLDADPNENEDEESDAFDFYSQLEHLGELFISLFDFGVYLCLFRL